MDESLMIAYRKIYRTVINPKQASGQFPNLMMIGIYFAFIIASNARKCKSKLLGLWESL
jgi:hypothetical protein